jgi:hypothetical protein
MAGKESSMNRVLQIKEEMKELENQLEQLKKELNILQMNCDHEFKSSNYIQECTKCHLIESLNW